MTKAYFVGPKGQVVISKEIRDCLGIEPGWFALQRLVDDHLEIRFLPPEHAESLAGSLAKYVTEETRIGDQDWHEVREKAWEDHVRERWVPPSTVE